MDAFVDNNLGDDLMLDLLVRRYPGTLFLPLRDARLNALEPYAQWPNLIIPDWVDLPALLPLVDAFLIYGGSAWQDHGDNLNWYLWRRDAMAALKARGVPLLALGNNLGPVRTKEGAALFTSLILDLDHLTVRDTDSFRWLEAHVPGHHGVLTGDLVLQLDRPRPPVDEGLVGISVHRSVLRPAQNEAYVEGVVGLVRRLHAARPELRIGLFGFDTVTERDDLVMDQIFHRLGRPAQLSIHSYLGDLPAFLDAFGRCSSVFACRFHAVILALLWGMPFTPFDYLGKTRTVLEDLAYRGPLITHGDFPARLDEICAHMLSGEQHHDATALAAMIARAGRNFDHLDARFGQGDPLGPKQLLLDLLAAHRALARA